MTDDKYRAPEPGTLQGSVVRPNDPEELMRAVEAAFDYRGDVTLDLTDGSRVEGYIFNRHMDAGGPALELFPKDQPGTCRIAYAQIAAIAFTGIDTASGKSWETWAAKKASQRKAEADQVVAEAQARGHL